MTVCAEDPLRRGEEIVVVSSLKIPPSQVKFAQVRAIAGDPCGHVAADVGCGNILEPAGVLLEDIPRWVDLEGAGEGFRGVQWVKVQQVAAAEQFERRIERAQLHVVAWVLQEIKNVEIAAV